MTYEELMSILKEYCLNNVSTNYNSIINTVEMSKDMGIVFDTINSDIKYDSYYIYVNNDSHNTVVLNNIYRIDIEFKDSDKSASVILSMLNEKEYKILFISKHITSCYGVSCKNINEYMTRM